MHIKGAKKHRLVGDPPAPVETDDDQDAADQPRQIREQIPLRQPGRRGSHEYLSSTNIFGLTSRSEQFYPELFRPVSRLYWLRSSTEEQAELIRRQAEIVEKLSYRDKGEPRIPTTQADMAYDSARSRRYMAMRRRRKRRGYEARKQEEEERRKAPLVRRYISRDARFGITPIMTVGALATPVVISGLLRKAPAGARGRREFLEAQVRGQTRPPPRLPVIDTSGSPQVSTRAFNNKFGLRSRAVADYPEVYAKVSQAYWRSMSAEDRRSVYAVQASAMEKVGFEQGTAKYFTLDFDPMQQNIYSTGREEPAPAEVPQTRPTSVIACILLILAGVVSSIAALFAGAEPGWLLIGAALIAVGICLGIPVRRRPGG